MVRVTWVKVLVVVSKRKSSPLPSGFSPVRSAVETKAMRVPAALIAGRSMTTSRWWGDLGEGAGGGVEEEELDVAVGILPGQVRGGGKGDAGARGIDPKAVVAGAEKSRPRW